MPHLFDFIHLKSRADLPHLGIVVLLVFGIILGVYLSLQPQLFKKQAQESSIVEIKFIPDSLQIQTASVYEVKIAINPKGERVTGLQLYISYDPSVLNILEVRNERFLPITLKSQDSLDGTFSLIYGSVIETNATQPGMVATLKFKVNESKNSQISIKENSQVAVSSREGNVLTAFAKLNLSPASGGSQKTQEEIKYPDNLLLEKAFLPESEPFVRDFKEASEPKPEIKPERVKPSLSEAYIKQLGRDIFIEPIVALNQVIEEKAGEIIKNIQ